VPDVLQMVGRANRPLVDNEGKHPLNSPSQITIKHSCCKNIIKTKLIMMCSYKLRYCSHERTTFKKDFIA